MGNHYLNRRSVTGRRALNRFIMKVQEFGFPALETILFSVSFSLFKRLLFNMFQIEKQFFNRSLRRGTFSYLGLMLVTRMHSILTWLDVQCKNGFEQGKNKYFFLTQKCRDEGIVNFLKEYLLH